MNQRKPVMKPHGEFRRRIRLVLHPVPRIVKRLPGSVSAATRAILPIMCGGQVANLRREPGVVENGKCVRW
jgi:hypothetical protein